VRTSAKSIQTAMRRPSFASAWDRDTFGERSNIIETYEPVTQSRVGWCFAVRAEGFDVAAKLLSPIGLAIGPSPVRWAPQPTRLNVKA
jgi:hypothetical protein